MAENKTKKGILVTIGLLILSKAKWLFAILKFSKFGVTFISLIVSLAGYAVIFGWKFAAAIVYLIFVHEMGHLVAAKQKGIKTSPAVFVPFLGAVIGMKEQPKDAATEAYLAYGGPLAGLISIMPAIGLFYMTDEPYWALVIMLGAMINLFNLFPVSPLDGGRIVGVLSTKIWFVALIVFLVFLFYNPSPLLFLIFIFGIFTWWSRARDSYKSQKLDLEIQTKKNMRDFLEKCQKDVFYTHGTDDEGDPLISPDMILYHIRTLQGRIAEIETELSYMKKWYVPFLQDKERLKKDALLYERQRYAELVMFLQSEINYSELQSKITDTNHSINKLNKEKNKLKTYYKAKPSTKWKVFIAYVVLAVCLSLLFVYYRGILDAAYGYIYAY
ncbi:Zn-dependent protease [Scopulibacillus darangshiensis]|uniref:Zn-dependent protease n=1 Tax=Scopulibacillus darangshiensis TaxID=442528 RepID=A0A4V2SLK6_9BACL|nr:site-2 protease family protein [Scopulibacillus darangshiensis]TCP23806.1 Zn-dependent protease [Scopulibacillus darangshiensis]